MARQTQTTGRKRLTMPRLWFTRKRFRVPVLLAFSALALAAHVFAYFQWDLRAECGLQMFLGPRGVNFMQLVSLAGNGWIPYLLTAFVALVLLALRQPAAAGALVLSAGGSGGLNALLKWFIGRPRPVAADCLQVVDTFGFLSFPSGHVTFYVCFFGFFWLLAWERMPNGWARRAVMCLLAVPVILVSFSRVTLGAHWPSDTLGAYLWSSLWLGFAWEMYKKWDAASRRS
jgi:membrane-associated phospholipid phosphatase